MKKTIYLLLLFVSVIAFSQEAKDDSAEVQKNYNELKLNALYFVSGAIEIIYERTLNDETGIGISAMVPYTKNISKSIQYYISPYFRKYFGKKYASGFFVEGFGMLNSSDRSDLLDNRDNFFVTDFSLGVGIGGKWVTKGGFIAEINFGIGRNLFQNNENYNNNTGKGSITLGYRF